MSDEVIEVTIGPDGKVELLVNGVAGMDCLALTEDLVQLLGSEVESQDLTGEAYVETGEEQAERLWH